MPFTHFIQEWKECAHTDNSDVLTTLLHQADGQSEDIVDGYIETLLEVAEKKGSVKCIQLILTTFPRWQRESTYTWGLHDSVHPKVAYYYLKMMKDPHQYATTHTLNKQTQEAYQQLQAEELTEQMTVIHHPVRIVAPIPST